MLFDDGMKNMAFVGFTCEHFKRLMQSWFEDACPLVWFKSDKGLV
jgi:hypothetical protein